MKIQLKNVFVLLVLVLFSFSFLSEASEHVYEPKPEELENAHQYADEYNTRGEEKYAAGDYRGSIKYYDRALKLDPQNYLIYINRGIAKANLDNHRDAIRDYDKAIELDPEYALAYYSRALSKENLGDDINAIKDYDKAIELDSRYVLAYHRRGILKYEIGDLLGARKDYDKSIELDPKNATTFSNRDISNDILEKSSIAAKTKDEAKEPTSKKNDNKGKSSRPKSFRTDRGVVEVLLGFPISSISDNVVFYRDSERLDSAESGIDVSFFLDNKGSHALSLGYRSMTETISVPLRSFDDLNFNNKYSGYNIGYRYYLTRGVFLGAGIMGLNFESRSEDFEFGSIVINHLETKGNILASLLKFGYHAKFNSGFILGFNISLTSANSINENTYLVNSNRRSITGIKLENISIISTVLSLGYAW